MNGIELFIKARARKQKNHVKSSAGKTEIHKNWTKNEDLHSSLNEKEREIGCLLIINKKKSKDNRTRQAMRSFRLNRKEKLGQCFFNSNHFINISKIDILSFLFVYTFFLFILREGKEKHTIFIY